MMPDRIAIPVLETVRLILRGAKLSDFPAFLAYSTSDRTAYVGGPKTPEQAKDRFDDLSNHWNDNGFGRFVIVTKQDQKPIGHVGPLKANPAAPVEMSWTLWTAEAEGQGFAREAAQAALAWSFASLDLDEILALVLPKNQPSRRVAESLGARYLGENKMTHGWTAAVYRFDRPSLSFNS